jgi:GPH family glycoside/pentoside/hexuronide:cation symporter
MSEPLDATPEAPAPSPELALVDAPHARGEERVSWSTILAYNAPTLGIGFMFFLVGLQLMKYATDVLLISPAVMGTIFGVSRIWDAISDPIAGYWSDRTNTRMGRRRPWLLASVAPIAVVNWMVWSPPEALSGRALEAWMAVGVIGFYSAMTIFVVPHASLGAELTTGYHDRSRVFGVRHALWSTGNVLALVGMYFLIVASQRFAEDGGAAARSTAGGQALLAAAVTAALLVWSVARLRERPDYQGRGASSPWRATSDVWRNPHARLLLIVFLIENLGAATIGILTLYIAEYIVGTPRLAPLYILAYMAASILSVPMWMPLARRFGKKRLWIFSMLLTAVSFGGMFFLQEGSVVLISVLAVTAGLAGGCGGMIGPSVQADVIDYDEYRTGERKEGAYFAAWNFVFKCAFGITLFLTGWVLELSGFRPNQEQTETARLALLSLYALYPLVCYGLGTLIFLRFRLDEREHQNIRRALNRRALEREGET